MSFPAFGSLACASDLVKSDAGITAGSPSFGVTVTFPFSSTTTVASFGFTALTLSSIAFFSASVSNSGFFTTVLSAGLTTSFPAFGLAASSGVLVKSFAGITAVLPSGVVTVAFPLSSTATVAPGLTAATLAAIAFLAASSTPLAGSTITLSAGFTMSFPAFGSVAWFSDLVKSFAGITAILPSGVVTVAFPFSSKTTFVGCSASLSGFTALILAMIASFSFCVNASGFATTVLSAGLTTSFPAFGLAASSAVLVKSDAGITATFPSLVVTVTFPLSSTAIYLASGFTSATFAPIASFSASVNLAGSFTTVLSAGLTISFPAFGLSTSADGFVKSFAGITAVLPFGSVTVAFPKSSTATSAPGFTALMLSSIAFLIATFLVSSLKSAGSATTLSAGLFTLLPAVGLVASSCVFTKFLTGIVAIAPSLVVTVAFPYLSKATFASGFTDFIFSAIAVLSVSVNLSGSATTLSAGVFTLFPAFGPLACSSVLTKSFARIVAVVPSSSVTVAFPLSSTKIAFVSGFTALIFLTIASLASSVNGLVVSATTLSDGLLMSFPAFSLADSVSVFTKSLAGITNVLPSGVVIVALPLSSTTTVVPSFGFTASTAFLIASLASSPILSALAINTLSTGFLIKSCLAGFVK